jgi:hypothetical protein
VLRDEYHQPLASHRVVYELYRAGLADHERYDREREDHSVTPQR